MKRIFSMLLVMALFVVTPVLSLGVTATEAIPPREAPIVGSVAFNELTPEQLAELPGITLERITSQPVTRADVIELYVVTDKNTGKRYARRWNATWGYWVDKDWIPIG